MRPLRACERVRALSLALTVGAPAFVRVRSVESLNTGKPPGEAEGDCDEAVRAFRYCADLAAGAKWFDPQTVVVPDDHMGATCRRCYCSCCFASCTPDVVVLHVFV